MPKSRSLPIENPMPAKSDVLQRIVGLAFCCPFSQSNPQYCELHELRKLPVRERLRELKNWDPQKLHNFEQHHSQCLRALEGAAEENE